MVPRNANKRLVLFHRDFRQFTGGHMKVGDYFNHIRASANFEPRIGFTPESKWNETNPWSRAKDYVITWEPDQADILFFAGMDWRALPKRQRNAFDKPIINLLQHVRHADPGSELRGFLRNRAVRICASQAIADAINATGEVNGPVFVIPYGIDLPLTKDAEDARPIDVVIGGLKVPELADRLKRSLLKTETEVECLTDWMPRDAYLERLRQAKVALVLPRTTEGFYLPALEAMACGAIVVCPDCIGNRHFCHDGINCFRPRHNFRDILAATKKALGLGEAERQQMHQKATATVRQHTMETERQRFFHILDRVDSLWAS